MTGAMIATAIDSGNGTLMITFVARHGILMIVLIAILLWLAVGDKAELC